MKLIRSLVFPWIVFFLTAVGILVLLDLFVTRVRLTPEQIQYGLVFGTVACLALNINSLGSVGIWMSESLPESLRFGSWQWILRALKAFAIAAVFWFVGTIPWMPLIWQAAILPTALAILLFVAVFSLLGPVLKFSSNMAWNRAFSVVLSFPILLSVPLTALFVSRTIVSAYRASKPEMIPVAELPVVAPVKTTAASKATDTKDAKGANTKKAMQTADAKAIGGKLDKRAENFRTIAQSGNSCAENDKEINAALEPRGPEGTVYWAIQATGCSGLRSVIAMHKLSMIMLEHPVPAVRAAAIRAMKKYGTENTRNIAYLLIKRLSEREAPEVIQAAAAALAPLGGDNDKFATKRLKNLLAIPELSMAAAAALKESYRREDVVAEYVQANLTAAEPAKQNAIGMICFLSKEKRVIAEPHIDAVLAMVKDATPEDPGVKALGCLDGAGFKAIREEVMHPRRMDRVLAARVLSGFDVKDNRDVLETATSCVRDNNDAIRKYCSQTLGQVGAIALPKIMELIGSGDTALKLAGQNALTYLSDAKAKEELKRIRNENSGWMANNRKLQIARAANTALVKISLETGSEKGQSPTEKTGTH